MVFETVIALRGVDIVCSAQQCAAAFGRATALRLLLNIRNLQNLPAGAEGEATAKGRYGKYIKSCFQAPPARMLLNLEKLRNFIQTLKQTLEGAA